ncbi:facilitated trehalose transporter Tret1-like [Diabrotica undecimpunctata]|uniref:facilitated trehalose transporter Tret1-like n=1 Tax=Diabrotica undecimpunctata TaxID=50387 RepID=UPI003B63BFAF
MSQKSNYFLYWAVLSVNFLSINISSLFSWTSPTIPKLYSNDTSINPLGKPITAVEESLIASLPNIGSIVGTIVSGLLAEKLGRKRTLILSSVPCFVCYILIANASKFYLFAIARLIIGIFGGIALAILPSYVAEISEDSNRGILGSIFGIMNAVGHVCSFVIGPLISIQSYAYFLLVPVTIFLVTFVPFIPESPYYYMMKNDTNQAEKVLKKIRKNSDVSKELLHIQEVVYTSKCQKVNWKELTIAPTRNGLIACCGLLLFQQFMGIPFILLYLQPILDASGNIIPSNLASIIIGFVQLALCTVSTIVIDRVGKKILLQISSIGSIVSLVCLGMYFYLQSNNYNVNPIFWLPLASLINFYVFFNIGYSTIPWTIGGELFATNVKSICVSIGSFCALSLGLIIVAAFPFIREAFGMSGVFFIFSGIASLSIIFVSIFVPETKGKSFLEIQNALSRRQKHIDYNKQ